MQYIFSLLKQILGPNLTRSIRPLGHGIKAYLASAYFGFPGKKLTLIGINGTKGKTSTTILTGRFLNKAGIKTGYVSTALVYLGNGSYLEAEGQNTFKMTSIDAVILQRLLSQMVKNGCTHAVLEMSSQGLEQHRHWGLGKFEVALFLNAYPEHIEAHGSWENYLQAKQKLFSSITKNGIFIGNNDDKTTPLMWNSVKHQQSTQNLSLQQSKDYLVNQNEFDQSILTFESNIIPIPFDASFEAINTAFALKTVSIFAPQKLKELIAAIQEIDIKIPGRFEWILKNGEISSNKTQKLSPLQKQKLKNFQNLDIIVDYAHEPESMKQVLSQLGKWREIGRYTQVIHILSCDGVGRDDWKKPKMGDLSYQYSDFTICTTDNYETGDNPEEITKTLAQNFPKDTLHIKYLLQSDRFQAFNSALSLALKLSNGNSRTIIISTGVGNEYGLTRPEGIIDWNEGDKWIEALIEIN